MNATQIVQSLLGHLPPRARKISIGVIGVGAVAQEQHLPGLRAVEGCSIQALSGRSGPDRVERNAESYGVEKRYSDWRQMVDEEPLDAVSIATPPADHFEMAAYCLQAGLHVMVEKPMVTSTPELESLVLMAEKSGRLLLVRQNFRFSKGVYWARQLLKAGTFGKVIKMDMTFSHSGPRQAWHFQKDHAGGGVFMDLGIHLVDLARYVLDDEVEQVRMIHSRRRPASDVEDEALAFLQMRQGPLVTLQMSWNGYPCDGHFTLVGDQVMARIQFCPRDYIDWNANRLPKGVTHPLEPHPAGPDSFHHFIACIRNGRESIIAASDNAHSLEVILKGYESARG